ncbi:Signal peptidase II [Alteripontixanthobacter maritimus]|uniref:Lipoprotein signal peptidase n=1 Tax=Alteripontixanthobacter maritimus TaxID=2161824 RepID=A0A369Q866_9SPHN|nr:signal peptidase II [Alteripontixanthobacter maritimus]RDC61081.1 Signal peptidase II [Alteripontixanthobacter maritimus]
MTVVTKRRLIGLAIALAIFAVDQYIKWLMVGPLDLRNQPGGVIELIPFFDLRWTQNFGISLGLFEATSMEMRWALVAVTALIAVVVTIWMLRERVMGDIIGLSLILGGALGNIKDRYDLGYVIDYADLHFGTFRPFLIFNVADAAITIGVLIILARSFFMSEKDGENDEPAPDAAETNHA